MDEHKTQELLLRLIEDMAIVKSKLDSLEEIKLEARHSADRIDKLEMQNERHEKSISSLEKRANTMEQFVRNNMIDSKKQMSSVYISIGMAVFSMVLTLLSKFIM